MALSIFAAAAHAAETAIAWIPDSRVLVQEGGQYARMARLADGKTLLCAFTWRRALHIRRSNDEGRSWSEPQQIAAWQPGNLANAELLVLKNGDILAFFNRRPEKGSREPHSIGCCRSTDQGATWSDAITIYGGEPKRDKGCWEPAGLELPDGKVAVWFANENPFPDSHDQEVSVTTSTDHGLTWSEPRRFSYRAGSRDGMPVPVLSPDGKSVFAAIEDNGLSGTFKPVVLTAPVAAVGTSTGFIDAKSSRRRGALADPLPAAAYAGAPYLRMLPGTGGGRSVLSFQLAPDGDMQHSKMAVCLGDAKAAKFGAPSFPFGEATGSAQLWNAVFVKKPGTVTAISETAIDGKRGVWAIDGEIRGK